MSKKLDLGDSKLAFLKPEMIHMNREISLKKIRMSST